MERNICAICDTKLSIDDIICNIHNVPIKITCTDNKISQLEDMIFAQCNKCNTIQLQKLIPLEILYNGSHNFTSSGILWDNYFKLFSKTIDNYVKDKTILEIGCPSGKIAMNVNNYNKWFIIEPNINKDIHFNKNIYYIESFFDENLTINENIDLIIHSHLFEHIYYPNNFLKKCYELLNDNGEMFFGVPNMTYFTQSNNTTFLGLFFEHTIFLNEENIVYLLSKNNFKIINIIYYDNHSIIYHCKKISKDKLIINNDFKITNYYTYFIESINKYKEYINQYNYIILSTNKDIYLFGASYNTQQLLVLGLLSNKIKGILDNCTGKHNKFFYGYDLKICDPKTILSNNNNCIVILKNGNYTNEIKEQILSINPNIEIIM